MKVNNGLPNPHAYDTPVNNISCLNIPFYYKCHFSKLLCWSLKSTTQRNFWKHWFVFNSITVLKVCEKIASVHRYLIRTSQNLIQIYCQMFSLNSVDTEWVPNDFKSTHTFRGIFFLLRYISKNMLQFLNDTFRTSLNNEFIGIRLWLFPRRLLWRDKTHLEYA